MRHCFVCRYTVREWLWVSTESSQEVWCFGCVFLKMKRDVQEAGEAQLLDMEHDVERRR